MGRLVLTNAYFMINSVDLSDHVRSIAINYSAEQVEATTMGDASRRRLPGLKDWSMEVTFNQDFDASKVDATLFSLVGAQTAVKARAVNASISSTNPEFQGNGLIDSYPILAGQVGALAEVSITINCSDGAALIRATS